MTILYKVTEKQMKTYSFSIHSFNIKKMKLRSTDVSKKLKVLHCTGKKKLPNNRI